MLQDDEKVKDIVHELFTVLWTKRNMLNISIGINSYLYGSVHNRVLDVIVHKKVIDKQTDSLASYLENGGCSVESKAIEKELLQVFEKILAQLPEKCVRLFSKAKFVKD